MFLIVIVRKKIIHQLWSGKGCVVKIYLTTVVHKSSNSQVVEKLFGYSHAHAIRLIVE